MPTADEQIRGAIGTILTGAFGAASPAITAQVYPWNVLSHELTEWPALFELAAGGRHGWVIKRVGQRAERKNAQRDKQTNIYDLWGFYSFRSGKKNDNSDDEFARICGVVYDAIKAQPRLGFDNLVEWHELLQFDRITWVDCGEETLHFAPGRLVVHLCC